MNALVLAQKASEWNRLKGLVLDNVSSPITRRVYNLALNEFFEWFGREPRPGLTKATVSAWRVALEALSGVNYFFCLTTTISLYQRQLLFDS